MVFRNFLEQEKTIANEIKKRQRSLKDIKPHIKRILPKSDGPIEDRYKILRKLGEGGNGRVYLGHNCYPANLRYPVVIKKLSKMDRPRQVHLDGSRLLLEAQVLYNLADVEGIPQILSWFEGANYFYIVMKHIANSIDLNSFINLSKTGHLSEETAYYLARQLVSIVQQVNARGFLHGDIKPGNIIVDTRRMRLLLIDFGSVESSSAPMLSTTWGTFGYMPPQCYIHPYIYTPNDMNVFGIAVTIFKMVYGSKPFRNECEIKRCRRIGEEDCSSDDENEIKDVDAEDMIEWDRMSKPLQNMLELCFEGPWGRMLKLDEMRVHPWLTQKVNSAKVEKEFLRLLRTGVKMAAKVKRKATPDLPEDDNVKRIKMD